MNINIKYIAIVALFAMAFNNQVSAQQTAAPLNNAMSYITRLQPVTFQHTQVESKKTDANTGVSYGFNLAELRKVVPGIVKTHYKMVPAGKNSFKTVSTEEIDLDKLIPLLVGSIKEQQVEMDRMKAEIESLKQQLKK